MTFASHMPPNNNETEATEMTLSNSAQTSHDLLATPERYHGLDAARAAAMLLGVFYHLPIAMMGGGFMGGPPSPKTHVDNWLHSFRMTLFFMLSGFFACMMFEKYGVSRFFVRRWWRIGVSLVISFSLLVGFRIAVEQIRFAQQAHQKATTPSTTFPGGGFFPPMPPFPNTVPFPNAGPSPNAGPPPPNVGTTPAPIAMGWQFPGMPSRKWSNYLFGDYSRHMGLEHLWFLWYLLVMVMVAPLPAYALGKATGARWVQHGNTIVKFFANKNLLGLAIGFVGLPLLLHAKGFMGWSLANPYGFSGAFPDFMIQYYPDWPYYAFFFAIGWWLFITRSSLHVIEHHWKWALALGIGCYVASQWLSSHYSFRPEYAKDSWVRIGAFTLYGVGAAYSVLGFLGVFQRYLNRPSRHVRYLADTALWVYLVHLPLIPYVMGWIEPWRTTWWEGSIGGMALVTGICLAAYELIVRPTFLIYIYGPSTPARKGNSDHAAK
jgi:hypothetical protein